VLSPGTYWAVVVAPAPSGGDDTAALQAKLDGGGLVVFKDGGTYKLTGTTGLSVDVSKTRLIGRGVTIDASGMTSGVAVTITSSLGDPAEYGQRSARWVEGIVLGGPGKASTVDGVKFTATAGSTVAHGDASFVVHDFRHGVSLGDNAHNIEVTVDAYNCTHCIDDSAATANAGENIRIRGALFNSTLAAYLHNGSADYTFEASFDYNGAVLDISGATVTCVGCHTEGNDANYGTNYPFTVAGTGSLLYSGGILTGALTTIPAYVHTAATTAFATFRDTRVLGWTGTFWDGTGNVLKTTSQTSGDSGGIQSTVDRTAATGVVSTISFGTRKWDTTGTLFTGNLNRITAPQAGFYLVAMKIQLSAVAGGSWRQAWLALNGNDANDKACPRSYPVNTLVQDAQSEIVYLSQGDYYELHIYQDSGSNVTVTAANGGPVLSLTRVA
jgi:hypothetical protein